MTLTSSRLPEGDVLHLRLRKLLLLLILSYPPLLLTAAIRGTASEFVLIHLGMYAISVVYFIGSRDHSLIFFIVTHSFWLFSYLIFLYAFFYAVSADRYLVAPIRSSLIAALYLTACLSARVVGLGLSSFNGPRNNQSTIPVNVANAFCLLGLAFIPTRILFGSESFWYAMSGTFTQFYWLGLYFKFDKERVSLSNPFLLTGIIICLAVSILDGRRALVIEFSLTFFLIYLRTSARAITVARCALFLFAGVYLARFSDIILYARIFIGKDRPADVLSFILSSLFSTAFLLAPFGNSESSRIRDAINSYVSPFSNYRVATFEGRTGILERATLLPTMDTVIGVLPEPGGVNWLELRNILFSILPSVGQDKDVSFADRLTWLTGLRPQGSIGHPLVTAAGEFFAMGGYPLLYFYALAIFSILFLELKFVANLFGNGAVAIMFIFTQAFYMMFSSTAISATAVVIRQIPFVICIYLLMSALTLNRAK